MTDEKLKKANELKKRIDSENSLIKTLQEFINKDKITEVKLATSQNSCLQYILSGYDLLYLIEYLTMEHNTKLNNLIEEYENL